MAASHHNSQWTVSDRQELDLLNFIENSFFEAGNVGENNSPGYCHLAVFELFRGYLIPTADRNLSCGLSVWWLCGQFSFFFKLNKGELPPIPQHLSQSCKDFIKRCLQFRPEDRPTASELLLHPFVANAPATAAAAAFVSPSPAAVYM